MSIDTDVLIAGAGMSGLGFAVQLVRKFGTQSFELIEKADDVGGTWNINSYPGCGCDVPSHFYSYSFALNPHWSRKYSMQSEIQAYFRSVADRYNIIPHIRFHSTVETATWEEESSTWLISIKDTRTGAMQQRRSRVFISAVGALSVPKECEIPGAEDFKGHIFHSSRWDHSFKWADKDVVVLGNGCSATQFVPILTTGPSPVHHLTQFARQAHFLAARIDFAYSSSFKSLMRYMPLAMRLYRAKLYADMERDFAGFDITTGASIREGLKQENRAYVEQMAPERYVEALVPRTTIGCKRKVLDTGYLACLHSKNMKLVADDPVVGIEEEGVVTEAGRKVKADAIVLATGFATHQMLFPMEIRGREGVSLNDHWEKESAGAPSAYFGTCVPSFPNFFILMGPNTVTGHLSVIYTVECQINFALRLIAPILRSSRPSLLSSLLPSSSTVAVTAQAARYDSDWLQSRLTKLVWSSGCRTWALHPETGQNIMMYPDPQYMFWLRSLWVRWGDFEY
ncbi:cyclohexanone 1,2-monooxygenase, partial [Viridothelium virens]